MVAVSDFLSVIFGCLFCMALLGGFLYRTGGRARVSNIRARVLVDNSGLDFSAVGGRLGLHQPLDVVEHRAQQQAAKSLENFTTREDCAHKKKRRRCCFCPQYVLVGLPDLPAGLNFLPIAAAALWVDLFTFCCLDAIFDL